MQSTWQNRWPGCSHCPTGVSRKRNDEARKSNDERGPNDEFRITVRPAIWICGFVLHSSFAIRHLEFPMTLRTLIRRSLRFHWRAHLGVVLGAAIGSAVLVGALVVGDSVRESLRERALQRLGWV